MTSKIQAQHFPRLQKSLDIPEHNTLVDNLPSTSHNRAGRKFPLKQSFKYYI